MNTIGTLYGIGVGPGDPELITVKAFRLLQQSPVIAYPKKRMGSKSYAHQISELYVKPSPDKEMLGLVFPMTKDKEILEREWNNTADIVWERLREGKDVAFVTEGDPLFYSTFIHMMRVMKEKYPEVPVVTVPGISSFLGAAARLNLPLADGDEQIGIIPATEDRDAMRKALLEHDCVIFLKVAKVLPMIIDLLKEMNLVDKAAVATKVTSAEEMIWTNVRELERAELGYLTLMVVKKG
ncbi:precorrin-2 C(20)-methyltransferase [Brevibacillus composti]|uniref:Precorrin-2 C(20)-methyltransferase n=1 Tax=Brevibacillus composti TaxID=2796470 RepID=A0A7T5EJA7_9BACL|nr:precorrin-2 C(20)-methyltransferase [Brevibacillus composti]QQE73631.1 precorrin-2 C(20)-methyltransferase [Brevibacillus composti]QUO40713.1 precorrin-2 C(20)-methyltransferase [Brevibacillus composti]